MPDVTPYVSEQLAKGLTAEGRFQLAPAKAPDDIPIITPNRARELARAYLRSWRFWHGAAVGMGARWVTGRERD